MAILANLIETIETGATGWLTILNQNLSRLDPNRISTGLLSARPTSYLGNRFYYATDIKILYYDTGAAWAIAANGMQSKTPSSAADTGTAGEIAYDASYIYICTAANTWRRIAHASW